MCRSCCRRDSCQNNCSSDGERQILARYPNFDAKDPLYGGWAFVDEFPPAGAPEGHLWKRTLYVKPEDVRKWAHPEDVELDIFAQYGWWNFIEPVALLDPQTRMLTLKKDCGYDLHPHNRYHFQNALEELDAPGEWFYDKHTGTLYFWPTKPIAECEVRLPTLDGFFKVKTGAKKITIRGLTLTGCTAAPSPLSGRRTASSKMRHHAGGGLPRQRRRRERWQERAHLALRDQLHRQQWCQPERGRSQDTHRAGAHRRGQPHSPHGRLQQERLRHQHVWRGQHRRCTITSTTAHAWACR
jgi:hypothetical protein